jgi:hypothetical protein
MKNVDKDLAQREKTELIAMIKHMLQQQPELEWLLQTPVPIPSQRTKPVNPQIYRDQIAATPQECHIIAGWVREALSLPKGAGCSFGQYDVFLAALERGTKR